MLKIKSLTIGALSNAAHFLFVQNFIGLVKKNNVIATALGAIISKLEAAFKVEDSYYQIPRKSEHTAAIKQAIEMVLLLNTQIRQVAQSQSKTGSEAERQAGSRVYNLVKSYGVHKQRHLARRLGIVINLVADLQSNAYKQDVTTLGLTSVVEKMKTYAEEVNSLLMTRSEEQSQVPKGAMKQSRRVVDKLYKQLCEAINASIILAEDTTPYETLVAPLNETIDHYRRNELGSSTQPQSPSNDSDEDSDLKPKPEPEVPDNQDQGNQDSGTQEPTDQGNQNQGNQNQGSNPPSYNDDDNPFHP